MPTLTTTTVGQFCRELACGIDTLEEVLADWSLDETQYNALRKNPWFQKELVAAVTEIKDLGPNSAYIMKCRGVAEATLPEIYNIIKNERIDPAVRVGAYKQITELGRLGVPKGDGGNGGGPSVVFHFGPGINNVPETMRIVPGEVVKELLNTDG